MIAAKPISFNNVIVFTTRLSPVNFVLNVSHLEELSSLLLFHFNTPRSRISANTRNRGRLHSKIIGIYQSISAKELWSSFTRNVKCKVTLTIKAETRHAIHFVACTSADQVARS